LNGRLVDFADAVDLPRALAAARQAGGPWQPQPQLAETFAARFDPAAIFRRAGIDRMLARLEDATNTQLLAVGGRVSTPPRAETPRRSRLVARAAALNLFQPRK